MLVENRSSVKDVSSNSVNVMNGKIEQKKDTIEDAVVAQNENRTNWFVMALTTLFGMSTILGIVGIMVELPLLGQKAPESWSLPSNVLIIMNMANVIPWCYSIYQKYATRKVNDSFVIMGVMLLSTATLILAPSFIEKSVRIGDSSYSIPTYLTAFLLTVNSTTAFMVFVPYMGRFKQKYLVGFFVGEGLSSLVPSVLSLIQDVRETECHAIENSIDHTIKFEKYVPPTNFGIGTYLYILAGFMLICCIGFVFLDRLAICKNAYDNVKVSLGSSYEYENSVNDQTDKSTVDEPHRQKVSDGELYFLLVLITLLSIMTSGIVPALQSYSTLPYSDAAYHYAALVAMASVAIMAFSSIFLPTTSWKFTLILVMGNFTVSTYIIVASVLSPNPPFVGTEFGNIFIIICWAIENGSAQYSRICIVSLARLHGGRSMVWVGVLRQVGSVVGTAFIFILVNCTDIFRSTNKC